MPTPEEIDNNYGYHKGTSETIPKHELVRLLFCTLAHELNELLPEGRHKSIALTDLEKVAWAAHASVAINLAPLDRAPDELST